MFAALLCFRPAHTMSLFLARDFWSTKAAPGEEFDKGCLCVANVDNEPDGKAKVCVVSFF